MCFPFYKDLSGIISWNKPDKYLRSWYLSLAYAVHAPTEIINQSCENLRFTFTKKNSTIFFTIFFHFFNNLLGVEIALWAEYPLPAFLPPKRKFFVWHHLSLVVVTKEVIDCKFSNWNKSQLAALLPVPSCTFHRLHGREKSKSVGNKQCTCSCSKTLSLISAITRSF